MSSRIFGQQTLDLLQFPLQGHAVDHVFWPASFQQVFNAADTAVSPVTITPELKKLYLSSTCEGDFAYVDAEETISLSGDPWGASVGSLEWTIDKPDLAELILNVKILK